MMRSKTELEDLGMAADLLQQMFSELSVLAVDVIALARKLSDREAEITGRLRALSELIALLRSEHCSHSYVILRGQAAALIKSLSTILDVLAVCAYEANLADSEPALEMSNLFIGEG